MDDLQYFINLGEDFDDKGYKGFKPCYKWMTFNT